MAGHRPKTYSYQGRCATGYCAGAISAMTTPSILVANWRDGLTILTDGERRRELPGQSVQGLANCGDGGALAIVGGNSLRRRSHDGDWATIATSDAELSCCVGIGDVVYLGTHDARVFRVRRGCELERLGGFDSVPGRDTWYAGSVVINGEVVGPPLGVRSITATSDGSVILANVHVGGIPRSTDGGETWQATIDVDSDVHEVRAHPTRPEVVIAAAAVGLCISNDSGVTWRVEQDGLHASYCSAVAFSGDQLLVAAAADHFAPAGAVYRRPIDAGMPRWLDGIADTGCIATRDSTIAVVDKAGKLHVSSDAGRSWETRAEGLVGTSSVLVP